MENELIFEYMSPKDQRKNYYAKDVMAHPAKMPTYLARWIIDNYSSPDDWILDPMAGIGTTLIEGFILGRNVIGIEYEKKFVDLIKQSAKKAINLLNGRHILLGEKKPLNNQFIVINGDARKATYYLSDIKADAIIFSPPFQKFNRGDNNNYFFEFTDGRKNNLVGAKQMDTEVSEGSITLNDYGSVDLVAFSPPYHSTIIERGDSNANKSGAKIAAEKKGLIPPDSYSNDPMNIDNLKDLGSIDLISFSPPYAEGLGHAAKSENQEKSLVDLNRKYTNQFDKNNIASNKGESYLSAMFQVYENCYKLLKTNKYMVIVTKNFVKNKVEQRLDLDTIKICERIGFKLEDRYYHKLNTKSFWQLIQRQRCSNLKIRNTGDERKSEQLCLINEFDGKCPYKFKEQVTCQKYFNNYPQILYEDVLVFKK